MTSLFLTNYLFKTCSNFWVRLIITINIHVCLFMYPRKVILSESLWSDISVVCAYILHAAHHFLYLCIHNFGKVCLFQVLAEHGWLFQRPMCKYLTPIFKTSHTSILKLSTSSPSHNVYMVTNETCRHWNLLLINYEFPITLIQYLVKFWLAVQHSVKSTASWLVDIGN